MVKVRNICVLLWTLLVKVRTISFEVVDPGGQGQKYLCYEVVDPGGDSQNYLCIEVQTQVVKV